MATESLKYNIIRPGYMRRPFKNVKAHFSAPVMTGTSMSRKKLLNNFLNRLFVIYNRTSENCKLNESIVYQTLLQNIKFTEAEKEISGCKWEDDYRNAYELFCHSFVSVNGNTVLKVAETVNTIFSIPADINSNTIFLNRWEAEGGKMPLLFDIIHNLFISNLYQPCDFIKQYDFDLFFYQALPLYNEMLSKFEIDFQLYERLYVLYNLSFYYKGKSAAIQFTNVELVYYNRLQNRLVDLFNL